AAVVQTPTGEGVVAASGGAPCTGGGEGGMLEVGKPLKLVDPPTNGGAAKGSLPGAPFKETLLEWNGLLGYEVGAPPLSAMSRAGVRSSGQRGGGGCRAP